MHTKRHQHTPAATVVGRALITTALVVVPACLPSVIHPTTSTGTTRSL